MELPSLNALCILIFRKIIKIFWKTLEENRNFCTCLNRNNQ